MNREETIRSRNHHLIIESRLWQGSISSVSRIRSGFNFLSFFSDSSKRRIYIFRDDREDSNNNNHLALVQEAFLLYRIKDRRGIVSIHEGPFLLRDNGRTRGCV